MYTNTDVGALASRRVAWLAAAFALIISVMLAGAALDLAEAKSIKGTKQADKLTGTKQADRISGKAGNDRMVGKAGADQLKGGGGKDRINSVDGAKDKKISGGPGVDKCTIDAVDRPVVRGCEKIKTVGGSGGGGSGSGGSGGSGSGGSGGSGSGGGSGGGGSDQDGLTIVSSQGTTCAAGSLLPCLFQITGTGADTLLGTVTGGQGVTVAVGAGVSVLNDDWTAVGAYSCTGNGFIRVEIGAEAVEVPVTCTA